MSNNTKLREAEEALLDFVIRVSKGTNNNFTNYEVQVLPEVAKIAFENKAWLKD